MAYVLQDDIFFTNLTVRQTLLFTAYMKLPRSMTWKEKRQRVNDVIAELGIEKCQNTVIGNAFTRGVSGGERKRTNIGNELLMNPSLILLDEPTSGKLNLFFSFIFIFIFFLYLFCFLFTFFLFFNLNCYLLLLSLSFIFIFYL